MTTLNCFEYSLQENCLGWIIWNLLAAMILCFIFMLLTYVCIVYNDVSNVHWQTIYCEKFTVEETRHFTWAMFRQHDSWIILIIILDAHTESWRNLVAYKVKNIIRKQKTSWKPKIWINKQDADLNGYNCFDPITESSSDQLIWFCNRIEI